MSEKQGGKRVRSDRTQRQRGVTVPGPPRSSSGKGLSEGCTAGLSDEYITAKKREAAAAAAALIVGAASKLGVSPREAMAEVCSSELYRRHSAASEFPWTEDMVEEELDKLSDRTVRMSGSSRSSRSSREERRLIVTTEDEFPPLESHRQQQRRQHQGPAQTKQVETDYAEKARAFAKETWKLQEGDLLPGVENIEAGMTTISQEELRNRLSQAWNAVQGVANIPPEHFKGAYVGSLKVAAEVIRTGVPRLMELVATDVGTAGRVRISSLEKDLQEKEKMLAEQAGELVQLREQSRDLAGRLETMSPPEVQTCTSCATTRTLLERRVADVEGERDATRNLLCGYEEELRSMRGELGDLKRQLADAKTSPTPVPRKSATSQTDPLPLLEEGPCEVDMEEEHRPPTTNMAVQVEVERGASRSSSQTQEEEPSLSSLVQLLAGRLEERLETRLLSIKGELARWMAAESRRSRSAEAKLVPPRAPTASARRERGRPSPTYADVVGRRARVAGRATTGAPRAGPAPSAPRGGGGVKGKRVVEKAKAPSKIGRKSAPRGGLAGLGRVPARAAVSVACSEGKPGELVTGLLGSVSLEELGIDSLRPKRAANGSLLLEVPGPGSVEKAKELAQKLEAAARGKEGVKVTRPVKTAELRLHGVPDHITPENVRSALVAEGKCGEDEIRVGPIRPSPRGLSTAWVRLPVAAARRVAVKGRVRVGWVSVPVEALRARPTQCYRCLEFGHIGQRCTGAERAGLCYRCGAPGHGVRDCVAPPRCPLCTDAGRDASHRMGGRACTAPRRRAVPRTEVTPSAELPPATGKSRSRGGEEAGEAPPSATTPTRARPSAVSDTPDESRARGEEEAGEPPPPETTPICTGSSTVSDTPLGEVQMEVELLPEPTGEKAGSSGVTASEPVRRQSKRLAPQADPGPKKRRGKSGPRSPRQ